ncbi:hypothetical protein CASFOL_003413 [Castilleja foliolosa]|uniref:Uncharacterized protein n=1 Tax=Castilleja foliolosa TaxID=1961234 RepID=A0ABD3EH37_9LAMI
MTRRCVLWTPEMDFTKLCSCHDWLNKIERLNEFEKELMAKRRLINKSEVPWTLEKSSSIDCSIDKLNQMVKKMAKMLICAGVFGEHGDTDSDSGGARTL